MRPKLRKIKNDEHFIANSDAYMPRSITNYLDYTFIPYRNTLSTTNLTLNLLKPKNYLFDLIQTFEINCELLNETIKNINDIKERNEISLIYEKIKNNYHKKKELKKKVKDKKSKLLIELQIYSESKRKNEENVDYYKEQIKENEENFYSKEEYIKIFQRKLREIDIYIHNRTKNLKEGYFKKYQLFKINDFIEENNNLNKRKEELKKEINQLSINIDGLKKENKNYEEENIEISNEYDKNIHSYIKKYKNQILIITMRINLLKNYFNNMNKKLKYFNFNKKILSKEKNNEEEDKIINEEYDKSLITIDMNKKLNSYMDFSIVLNKKQNDESKFSELGKTLNFGQVNISNINMWDISAINNN